MKVQTTSGVVVVTENQLAWLGATGRLRDMSNYPAALPCYDDSIGELTKLLKTMPAGWAPVHLKPDPVKTVDPDDPEGSLIPGPPPGLLPGNETIQLLRSMDQSLKIIAGVIGQFKVRGPLTM